MYADSVYLEERAVVRGRVLYTSSLEAEEGASFSAERVEELPSPPAS